nr:MAG TPA: hypothetical protein [Caudoviricetes sp.]
MNCENNYSFRIFTKVWSGIILKYIIIGEEIRRFTIIRLFL